MKLRHLLCLSLFLASTASFGAEIAVDYTYSGDHNIDFSETRFSLSVGEVGDDRGGEANHIAEDYSANKPIAAIVQDALVQGFEHGGAELLSADADMQIVGRILSSELSTIERGGVEMLQLTFRTNIAVQGQGRTVWETTLFGRGRVPVDDGVEAAIYAAMDRMVRELVNDDYFLAEIQ